MPTITPFLWFDTQAEEAMNFYVSIFPRSKVVTVSRAGDKVMSVQFEIQGQPFAAMNGGAHVKFTDATSFLISCETQEEIDTLWAKLTAGSGHPGQCGWLKDKFGVSWQVVPSAIGQLLGGGGDPARAQRVVAALMTMTKIDLATLQRAYEGTGRA